MSNTEFNLFADLMISLLKNGQAEDVLQILEQFRGKENADSSRRAE